MAASDFCSRSEIDRGQQGLGRRRIIRLGTQVGTDPLRRPVEAVDLVAAVAAVLADQVVTGQQLGGRRIGKPLAGFQIDHLVMALQATAFGKPLGIHRKDPMMVVEPAVVAPPFIALGGIVGRMRGPLEIGGAPLPFVADRAANVVQPVWAERADEQVQPGMRNIGIRQATVDEQLGRRPPGQLVDQVAIHALVIENPAPLDLREHVADHQAGLGRRCLGPHHADRHVLGIDHSPIGQPEAEPAIQAFGGRRLAGMGWRSASYSLCLAS